MKTVIKLITTSVLLLSSCIALSANAAPPIRIAVVAPSNLQPGIMMVHAAELAASQINASGGVLGRKIKLYEENTEGSATESTLAFKKAVNEDHVIGVVGGFSSEATIATQPWAGRLKTPFIITGAGSPLIAKRVHDNYNLYKYTFRVAIDTPNEPDFVICSQVKNLMMKELDYKSTVILAENADWARPTVKAAHACLVKLGINVLDTIEFAVSTKDFSSIYNKITTLKPDFITTLVAQTGVTPTVQWHDNHVPALLTGWSSQASSGDFWKRTNGAAQGEITGNVGAPGAAVTTKSVPFQRAFVKRFGGQPGYFAYCTYDGLYILANAIERAKSTNPEALVKALESTNFIGVMGREEFYPRSSIMAHDVRMGPGHIPGVVMQWQNGKQVVLWPKNVATGSVMFPTFVPKPARLADAAGAGED